MLAFLIIASAIAEDDTLYRPDSISPHSFANFKSRACDEPGCIVLSAVKSVCTEAVAACRSAATSGAVVQRSRFVPRGPLFSVIRRLDSNRSSADFPPVFISVGDSFSSSYKTFDVALFQSHMYPQAP